MLFAAEAFRRGYQVSKPLSGKVAYDLVIDSGGKLFRVQVKCFQNTHNGKHGKPHQYNIRSGNHRRYVESDFDIIAIFRGEHNCWYIMPITEAVGRNINLGPSRTKYIDNWRIFEHEDQGQVHAAANAAL